MYKQYLERKFKPDKAYFEKTKEKARKQAIEKIKNLDQEYDARYNEIFRNYEKLNFIAEKQDSLPRANNPMEMLGHFYEGVLSGEKHTNAIFFGEKYPKASDIFFLGKIDIGKIVDAGCMRNNRRSPFYTAFVEGKTLFEIDNYTLFDLYASIIQKADPRRKTYLDSISLPFFGMPATEYSLVNDHIDVKPTKSEQIITALTGLTYFVDGGLCGCCISNAGPILPRADIADEVPDLIKGKLIEDIVKSFEKVHFKGPNKMARYLKDCGFQHKIIDDFIKKDEDAQF